MVHQERSSQRIRRGPVGYVVSAHHLKRFATGARREPGANARLMIPKAVLKVSATMANETLHGCLGLGASDVLRTKQLGNEGDVYSGGKWTSPREKA